MKKTIFATLMVGLIIALVIAMLPTSPPAPQALAGGYNIFNPGLWVINGDTANAHTAVPNLDSEDIIYGALEIDSLANAAVYVRNLPISHFTEMDDSVACDTTTAGHRIILFWQNTHDE